jgi:hypothetical protein
VIQKILTKYKVDNIYSSTETDLLVLSLKNEGVEIYESKGKVVALDMSEIDYISITPYNVLLNGEIDFINYSLENSAIVRKSHTYISSYDPKTNSAVLFFVKEGMKKIIKYNPANDSKYWETDVNNVRIKSCLLNNVLCVVHFDNKGIMLMDYLTGTILNNFHKEEFKFRRIIGTSESEIIFSSDVGILLFNPESQLFSVINIAQLLRTQDLDFGKVDSFPFEYNPDTGHVYSLLNGYFVEMDISKKELIKALDINSVDCNSYGIRLRIINHTRSGDLLYFNASDALRILKGGYVGIFDIKQEKIIYLLDAGLGDEKFFPGKSCPTILGDQMYLYDSEDNLMEFSIER